ncbi:amphi-Trp domain-containing protein [Halomarina halobia]|uniref:Amphi-Trp domain-containing protein n=1 Tax=Halomarina halobia TaxID=3033386 RepID=A0ABD6A9D7_9EURY|nr:amphi-Trp domain-containing protein [Halomarina sp. PSR21]
MANLPGEKRDGRTVITEGYFEREVHLSRQATATFLRELADQIEADTRLTISSADWEVPFEYREPIEVEVEFVSQQEGELEIELEFTGASGEGGLSVD